MLFQHIYEHNLALFEKNPGYSNEPNKDVFGNRVIIPKKRVKFLNQLINIEKYWLG
jgi:hypothetical protein